MKARDLHNIPDVQASPDSRKLAIDKVGIKAIRHPMRIQERSGGVQHTIAVFNMYVCLPHHFKGTHMSRFVEILEEHEREITVETFQVMLSEMVERLEAEEGHIEMSFPYFIEKKAPVSGVKSLMDYEVTFKGETKKGKQSFTMKVVVPVTSLCPCSKRISERGAHNQRSHVTVTERAYDNPKFDEDMVRDVAAVLNLDERIEAYVVESENFESIHNHSAYALIEKNKRAR